ncbi:MAG TPA: NAD(+) diphosphatase [Candidatus Merdenecus merdavium]|nr:NAD(+) diphosphatase [Candidatus Merdenecus merdavium]
MIQDIQPYVLKNEYRNKSIKEDHYICICNEKSEVLLKTYKNKEGELRINLPKVNELGLDPVDIAKSCHFLFSIDKNDYFLLFDVRVEEKEGFTYKSLNEIRDMKPKRKVYASAIAVQMNHWFDVNRFCGRCATPMSHHQGERAFQCPNCKNTVYPTLSPSVIVAITHGDRILLTKYAGRAHKRYALVAGYAEIGETLEETVRREVMEEVGLKVKNIRYYKSQPWPFSGSLLSGYFATLDGDDKITLQESELSEGTWYHRDHIPTEASDISLTNEMIEVFRAGKEYEF